MMNQPHYVKEIDAPHDENDRIYDGVEAEERKSQANFRDTAALPRTRLK